MHSVQREPPPAGTPPASIIDEHTPCLPRSGTLRQSGQRSTGKPLLDGVAEARAFQALRASGRAATSRSAVRRAANMSAATAHGVHACDPARSLVAGPDPFPGPIPTFQPQAARLDAAELCRLEKKLIDLAAKPASAQQDAPTLLLAYLLSCDDQAAARLLSTPALQALLTRRSRHGEPVLHVAIHHNQMGVIKRLLAHAADPGALIRAESVLGIHSLLLAGMQGNAEVMAVLLAHPAALALAPLVPPDRWNVLMSVTMDGNEQIAALLLDSASGAAQALATDDHGRNVLMYAAMQGQLGIAKLLLAHPSAFAQALAVDEEGQNALMLACCAGHAGMARLLLAHPASAGQVIEVAKDGDDPLLIAVRCGSHELVSMLLADPMAEILLDGVGPSGFSALQLAAYYGRTDLLACLLAAADAQQANARDADGCNALMIAAQHGHVDAVRMLLADTRTTAQVFDQDHMGLNALTRATVAGCAATVQVLLEDLSALGQVVAISEATFSAMCSAVMKEGLEKMFSLAGLPMADGSSDKTPGRKRFVVKELAICCPPSAVLTLLPVIARLIARKPAAQAAASDSVGMS